MSPGKMLIALVAIALIGALSYLTSTLLHRSSFTPTASQPATEPAMQPATEPTTEPPSKPVTPAADFQAIVERNGAVVLCVSNGELVLPDRCTGTGRLSIMQPITEGEIAWISATGVVALENKSPQYPDCALGRAKWDPTSEQTSPTGRKIRTIPAAAVAQQLNKVFPGEANLLPEDISAAFALDLDNDGKEEIIYIADSIPRFARLHEKTKQPYRFLVQSGIFSGRAPDQPTTFIHAVDEYRGPTDAIPRVAFKGIVPVATTSGEFAVLVKTGSGLEGDQSLVWLSGGRLERIETFEFRCY
jgi:hypothetical protein